LGGGDKKKGEKKNGIVFPQKGTCSSVAQSSYILSGAVGSGEKER